MEVKRSWCARETWVLMVTECRPCGKRHARPFARTLCFAWEDGVSSTIGCKVLCVKTVEGPLFYPTCSIVTSLSRLSGTLTEDRRLLGQKQWAWLSRSREYGRPSPWPLKCHRAMWRGPGRCWTCLFHSWGSPSLGSSSFIMGSKQTCSDFALEVKIHLDYTGQWTNYSSAPKGDTVWVLFQGCSIRKHPWTDILSKSCTDKVCRSMRETNGELPPLHYVSSLNHTG